MTKIFIMAGEASGDYLGSCLISDIKSICADAEFIGVGGEKMESCGLKSIFSVKELSIIGIWEVIGKIFHVKKLIDKAVEEIFSHNPDVIISIDSSGFTHRVDKAVKNRVRKNSLRDIPIIHYAAPPVWAWRSWRAKSLGKFIDKLLVFLPFEPELFRKYGLETVFVGHPIANDRAFERPSTDEIDRFRTQLMRQEKSSQTSKIITLLPGSRKSEIDAHIDVMRDFCKIMADEYSDVKFVIPTTDMLKDYILKTTMDWEIRPLIVDSVRDKVLAYYASDAAVAASGTVVLELARTGVPAVVIYRTSTITSAIVRLLIHVKFVSLVNILSNSEVIPELLQKQCTAENIFEKIKEILHPENVSKQRKAYKNVIASLQADDTTAAKEVIKTIGKS